MNNSSINPSSIASTTTSNNLVVSNRTNAVITRDSGQSEQTFTYNVLNEVKNQTSLPVSMKRDLELEKYPRSHEGISASDVADYFIWLANSSGSFVSNLKLQKLVYYAQAWHLAIFRKPLFQEDFEAWIHGPVIPVLYQQYKSFSWKPIEKEVDIQVINKTFEKAVLSFLGEVSEEYFGCDAYELERMTHVEDPWLKARGNSPMDVPSHAIIQKEWMQEYYGNRATQED